MTLISQLSFLVSIMVVDKWGESDLAHMSILFAHVFHFDAYLLSSEVWVPSAEKAPYFIGSFSATP
jgi:hypothetical protein